MPPPTRSPKPRFVGLDVGGTKFLVASADATGRILAEVREPAPEPLDEGLALLHAMIERVLQGRRPAAIGAAVGGPLDWRKGIVSPLHQPRWRDVPLKALMEARWGCPLRVDVDTNVAALGEYHFGGNRAPRLLYLTVSTGMGGGFLVDGKLYRGKDGAHPEVAHQAVPVRCRHPERASCECGAPDCLEGLVSGNGIRRIYGKPAEQLDEDEWAEVEGHLAQGLRNLATVYLPDTIVLGGGVACGRGEPLLARARAFLAERLRLVPAPSLALSRLGYHTALKGAIAVAIHGLD
jgi:predicted NBD/HSP70 family sugar kinase